MRNYQSTIIESLFSVISTGTHGVASSPTMSTAGGVVYSYKTPIARLEKRRGKWKLSLVTKFYSKTTSSQQHALKCGADNYGVEVVETEAV